MPDSFDTLVAALAAQIAARLPAHASSTNPSGPVVERDEITENSRLGGRAPRAALEAELARTSAARAGIESAPIAPDVITSLIDHTLLKADATRAELAKVCEEARRHKFASVCVNASNIPFVTHALAGSAVKPIAVVGFPLGASTGGAKAFEAREAVAAGAREIDMVINIGALKSRDYAAVQRDIALVVAASSPWPVKVILETGSLDADEKVIGCALAKAAGAAFVKTSTGFGPGGATVDDIALMRRIVGGDVGVKASGGVRTAGDAQKMVAAGADRIGASASVAIVTGSTGTSAY